MMRLIQKLILCSAAAALVSALPVIADATKDKAPGSEAPAAKQETVDLVVSGMV
jgi:hypothetical protein